MRRSTVTPQWMHVLRQLGGLSKCSHIFYDVVDPRILESMLVLSLALENCAQLMLQFTWPRWLHGVEI